MFGEDEPECALFSVPNLKEIHPEEGCFFG